MKYFGRITYPEDLITKRYFENNVDDKIQESTKDIQKRIDDIKRELQASIAHESRERENEIDKLKNQISENLKLMEDKIDHQDRRLMLEIGKVAKISADKILEEKHQREDTDNRLFKQLAQETAERIENDTKNSIRIETVKNDLNGTIQNVKIDVDSKLSNLNWELSSKIASNTNLIQKEAIAREKADAELNKRIDQKIGENLKTIHNQSLVGEGNITIISYNNENNSLDIIS